MRIQIKNNVLNFNYMIQKVVSIDQTFELNEVWVLDRYSRDQSVCKSTAFSRMKGAHDYEQVQACLKNTEKVEELGLKIYYIVCCNYA
jgi:hypothetical protein